MRKTIKSSEPTEAVQAINKTVGLLRITLIRAKPNAIPRSLRSQTALLAQHWFNWRLRGQSEIYPGMEKMAKWGECKEWQARQNTRTLEAWLAIRPIAYAKGGRRATRYVFSGEGLFRALRDLGCNPSPKLRNGLRQYDLNSTNDSDHENPVVMRYKVVLNQVVNQNPKHPKIKNQFNDVPVENPVVNPVVTTAGILTLFETSSPFEICGKEDPSTEAETGSRDQRQKDAGEPTMLVAASASEDDPKPTCTSEKTILDKPPSAASSEVNTERPKLSEDAVRLLDHLGQIGPSTYGACASALGWGVTRAWQAEAELVAANVVQHDTLGRMIVIANIKLSLA